MLTKLLYDHKLLCGATAAVITIALASTWQYCFLLFMLSGGAGPIKSASFEHDYDASLSYDLGLSTVYLLDDCGFPDKAVTLACTKMKQYAAKNGAESVDHLAFYLPTIDKSGHIGPQNWLELTSFPQKCLDDCLRQQNLLIASTESRGLPLSLKRHVFGRKIIRGLENHQLFTECLKYLHLILALDAKLDGQKSFSYGQTLVELTSFCSRHAELKDERLKVIALLQAMTKNYQLELIRCQVDRGYYYQLTKPGAKDIGWQKVSPEGAFAT